MMMYDKEKVYDDEIAPLMDMIIKICEREKIPMACQFYLKQEPYEGKWNGQPLFCTTVLLFKDKKKSNGYRKIREVAETMIHGK